MFFLSIPFCVGIETTIAMKYMQYAYLQILVNIIVQKKYSQFIPIYGSD